jgi:hypothetical protein
MARWGGKRLWAAVGLGCSRALTWDYALERAMERSKERSKGIEAS